MAEVTSDVQFEFRPSKVFRATGRLRILRGNQVADRLQQCWIGPEGENWRDVESGFEMQPPALEGDHFADALRASRALQSKAREFIALLHQLGGTEPGVPQASRDLALAQTHIEDAAMRAVNHFARIAGMETVP